MARSGSFRLKFWLILFLFLAIVVSGPFFWMPALAGLLIYDEGPAKADMAVVLAGDNHGQRVVHGAELARQGYVRSVIVSGPRYYDVYESDIAIQFAIHKGYPASLFISLPNEALSTREEARTVLAELQRHNVRSFLLVTSDFHTARSRRIYRKTIKELGGPEMRVVAAPDKYFRKDGWWKSREGLKIFFMEWSKTIATAMGI